MGGRDRGAEQAFEQDRAAVWSSTRLHQLWQTHRGLYVCMTPGRGMRAVSVWPALTGSRSADQLEETIMATDDKTRTELEAAVYRRLVEHLRARTDVQNIDLMNLAGFCRNCLSNWMKDAADAKGLPMTKDESREIVYGMPLRRMAREVSEGSVAAAEGGVRKSKPKALDARPFIVARASLCSAVDDARARLDLDGAHDFRNLRAAESCVSS